MAAEGANSAGPDFQVAPGDAKTFLSKVLEVMVVVPFVSVAGPEEGLLLSGAWKISILPCKKPRRASMPSCTDSW